ncbi:hypothetical protein EVAR_18797_1 [Eumeta japonica]|uniref:Uncharacterized protein n=1 Tax=Eumeta variegata TaxID=151549 RepID=A0A4C1UN98_EUMVA|nr:hypothetical protein EVAR_18797_1 [Eumeta japonica]
MRYYKLQQNLYIRCSCSPSGPTTTYEARAVIKKSDHLKTLSIILTTHCEKSVLRGDCTRNPRLSSSAGALSCAGPLTAYRRARCGRRDTILISWIMDKLNTRGLVLNLKFKANKQ